MPCSPVLSVRRSPDRPSTSGCGALFEAATHVRGAIVDKGRRIPAAVLKLVSRRSVARRSAQSRGEGGGAVAAGLAWRPSSPRPGAFSRSSMDRTPATSRSSRALWFAVDGGARTVGSVGRLRSCGERGGWIWRSRERAERSGGGAVTRPAPGRRRPVRRGRTSTVTRQGRRRRLCRWGRAVSARPTWPHGRRLSPARRAARRRRRRRRRFSTRWRRAGNTAGRTSVSPTALGSRHPRGMAAGRRCPTRVRRRVRCRSSDRGIRPARASSPRWVWCRHPRRPTAGTTTSPAIGPASPRWPGGLTLGRCPSSVRERVRCRSSDRGTRADRATLAPAGVVPPPPPRGGSTQDELTRRAERRRRPLATPSAAGGRHALRQHDEELHEDRDTPCTVAAGLTFRRTP